MTAHFSWDVSDLGLWTAVNNEWSIDEAAVVSEGLLASVLSRTSIELRLLGWYVKPLTNALDVLLTPHGMTSH